MIQKRSQNDPQKVPKRPQGCDSTSGTHPPRSLLLVEPLFFRESQKGRRKKKFTCALNPPRFSLSQKATASEGKGVNRRPPHPHSDTPSPPTPLSREACCRPRYAKITTTTTTKEEDEGRKRRRRKQKQHQHKKKNKNKKRRKKRRKKKKEKKNKNKKKRRRKKKEEKKPGKMPGARWCTDTVHTRSLSTNARSVPSPWW